MYPGSGVHRSLGTVRGSRVPGCIPALLLLLLYRAALCAARYTRCPGQLFLLKSGKLRLERFSEILIKISENITFLTFARGSARRARTPARARPGVPKLPDGLVPVYHPIYPLDDARGSGSPDFPNRRN